MPKPACYPPIPQMKNGAPLPFKAAGTDLGVVKIYSWERGPSPASLHAWIQNLYDVDSLSLWTLYVWHGPLYKDTNLKIERVAYFEHRKGLLKQLKYCLEICSHNFPESNEKPRNTYFRVKQCSGYYKARSSFSRGKFLFLMSLKEKISCIKNTTDSLLPEMVLSILRNYFAFETMGKDSNCAFQWAAFFSLASYSSNIFSFSKLGN